VKPLDSEAIIANAKECGGRILTVEDHYPEGVHKWFHSRGFLIL
jgi:transketolase C-terminal domain/subunit